MEIELTRKTNLFNLKILEKYLELSSRDLEFYYQELLEDNFLLENIIKKLKYAKDDLDFKKGFF